MSPPDVSIVARARGNQRLRFVLLAWVVALGLRSPDARAQAQPPPPAHPRPQPRSSPQTQPQDEVLFNRAHELWEAGRYAEACADFEESQRLVPHPVKLLNLGDCYEREQRLATAFRTFEEALRQLPLQANAQKRQRTEQLAQARLRELEPRVPSLRFTASPTPGAVVQLNGQPQPFGEALLVNPGVYQLEVSAPGHRTHRENVRLVEAQRLEYALPALSPEPSSSRFGLAPPVLVGAGLLVGGVAVYYGLSALASGRRLEQCPADDESERCDDLDNEWKSKANTSTWLWVGAGLLAGTGITLYVLESRSSSSSSAPQAVAKLSAWGGPSAAGLGVSGRF